VESCVPKKQLIIQLNPLLIQVRKICEFIYTETFGIIG
jgi:hypothetical protein